MRARFGALERLEPGGSVTLAPFDERGVISNAWIARGVQEKRIAAHLPRALRWWVLVSDGEQRHDLVTFDERWILFRPDPAVAWTWLR